MNLPRHRQAQHDAGTLLSISTVIDPMAKPSALEAAAIEKRAHAVLRHCTNGLLALGILVAGASGSQAHPLRVTLLGTGTPNPHPERFGPSTLIEAGSQKLLFDVGRGATIRLNQRRIPLRKVTAVFITHCHSDHLVGLADLWLTGWLPPNYARRRTPLRIWGPSGLRKITEGLEAASSTSGTEFPCPHSKSTMATRSNRPTAIASNTPGALS